MLGAVAAERGLEYSLERGGELRSVGTDVSAAGRELGVDARGLVLIGGDEDGVGADGGVRGEDGGPDQKQNTKLQHIDILTHPAA